MRRDGRELDHRTLETIRFMAVERVREGEPPSSVIASYGFCRTTIYKWLGAASRPGIGLKALRSTKAAGKPRTLSPRREQQVFRWAQWQGPPPVWPRFRALDAFHRGQSDRTKVRHSTRPDRGGRVAREAGPDPTKTVAEGLPTRSRSCRTMAAGDVSHHRAVGEGEWWRGVFLG